MEQVTVVLPFTEPGSTKPYSAVFGAAGWEKHADGTLRLLSGEGSPVAEFEAGKWLLVHDAAALHPEKRAVDVRVDGQTPAETVSSLIEQVLIGTGLFHGVIDRHEHTDGWHVVIADRNLYRSLEITVAPVTSDTSAEPAEATEATPETEAAQ